MPKSKTSRVITIVFVALAVAGSAWILGTEAGQFMQERKLLRYRAVRSTDSTAGLKVGDTLSEHYFEDLYRNTVTLTAVVRGPTVLVFFDPGCGSCDEEIKLIQSLVTIEEDRKKFILVSAGNPLHILDMVEGYGITLQVLYDHRGTFSSTLGIEGFPTNLFVNGDREIRRVVQGRLTADEIVSVLRE